MIAQAPHKLVIDFLEGVSTRKDATAFARGFIETHFESPPTAGYFVARVEGGFAYEAQEGGAGRAYLPAILKALAENPGVYVCIRLGKRILQVNISNEGRYTAVLLPEGIEPGSDQIIEVEPVAKLVPFQSKGVGWLITGTAFFMIGLLVLLVSQIGFIISHAAAALNSSGRTDKTTLPVSQWHDLMERVKDGATFITAMRWDPQSRAWRYETETVTFAPPPAPVIQDSGPASVQAEPPGFQQTLDALGFDPGFDSDSPPPESGPVPAPDGQGGEATP